MFKSKRPKKYKTIYKVPGYRTYIRYGNRRYYCTETGRYVNNEVILKFAYKRDVKIRCLYRGIDITAWSMMSAAHDLETKKLRKQWAKILKVVERTKVASGRAESLQHKN